MSGGGDNRTVAEAAASAAGAADKVARSGGAAVGSSNKGADIGILLVVLEPHAEKDEGSGGGGASRAGDAATDADPALLAEGARLARELGVVTRAVTWTTVEETDLRVVAEALGGMVERMRPGAVLLVDTDLSRQLAPMVAYVLGSAAILGCSDVRVRRGTGLVYPGDSEQVRQGGSPSRKDLDVAPAVLTFVKPVFGGWLERDVEAADGIIPVATLELEGMEEPDSPAVGFPAPEVIEVEPSAPSGVRRLETIAPDPRSVDLVHATRIVAAGAGSASGDLLEVVDELADLLEGSVGATRPMVDDGRLPKERLIGQTGRSVGPELYLALGISGSPHHLAGVRKADRVLSINRDARAPIFQFSDVGYVADLELVLPELVQKIKEWRDAPGNSE